jgi:16S rRNA (guanine966-N2)-methyltransferase
MIRIIGGHYRGKKLSVVDLEGLRPTPDRVRETVFNWLMHDIHGARCLDAFAGSGALGLEACSRGAAEVVFLEQAAKAHAHLQKVITQFAEARLKVVRTDALMYLQQSSEQFDLIFLDPPFQHNYLPQCIQLLAHSNILRAGGLIYLETDHLPELNPTHWKQIKLKQSGQVIYGLFEKY